MIIKLLFILALFVSSISAQTFAAINISASTGMGVSHPQFGAVVGRSTKVLDGEVSVASLCKRDPFAGGCGFGGSGRLTAKKSIFQVGGVLSGYKVENYSKSSLEGLVGLQKNGFELNYRHDFYSANRNRRVEGRFTKMFDNKLFFRVEGYYDRYKDFYNKGRNGFSETVSVGRWF